MAIVKLFVSRANAVMAKMTVTFEKKKNEKKGLMLECLIIENKII